MTTLLPTVAHIMSLRAAALSAPLASRCRATAACCGGARARRPGLCPPPPTHQSADDATLPPICCLTYLVGVCPAPATSSASAGALTHPYLARSIACLSLRARPPLRLPPQPVPCLLIGLHCLLADHVSLPRCNSLALRRRAVVEEADFEFDAVGVWPGVGIWNPGEIQTQMVLHGCPAQQAPWAEVDDSSTPIHCHLRCWEKDEPAGLGEAVLAAGDIEICTSCRWHLPPQNGHTAPAKRLVPPAPAPCRPFSLNSRLAALRKHSSRPNTIMRSASAVLAALLALMCAVAPCRAQQWQAQLSAANQASGSDRFRTFGRTRGKGNVWVRL